MNVLDQFSLKTKVVLVAGGEGFLGRAICETVRELGGTAISLDLKPSADQVVNITDSKAVVALGETAGQIDALVNCQMLISSIHLPSRMRSTAQRGSRTGGARCCRSRWKTNRNYWN